jgi:IS4 transposase
VNVLAALRRLKVGQTQDLPCWVLPAEGDAIRGRLIAVRRSAAATRHVIRKMELQANKKQKQVSKQRRQGAQFFMIWTSLPEETPADKVLSFYRSRWQIELSFKRMKSLLGLGHLPKKDPASARAWLHGKLLASLLVERVIQAAEATSPWGY